MGIGPGSIAVGWAGSTRPKDVQKNTPHRTRSVSPTQKKRRQPFSRLRLTLHLLFRYLNYFSINATSLAKYVKIISAPARLIAVNVSIIAFSLSTHPRSAAAVIMPNSPETL